MDALIKEVIAIAKRKRVGKLELLGVIENAEKEYLELKKKLEMQCNQCLREYLRQKKIDKEAYNRGLLRKAIRDLCCEHLNVAEDMDVVYCADCGTMHCKILNDDAGYLSHKNKR